MACMDCFLGKMRSNSVWESASRGPPAIPCSTRMPSSMPSEVDMPQRSEKAPKSTTEMQKSLTAPKRPANHPVSGTVMASATA